MRLLADDELGRTRERVDDSLPASYLDAFRAIERNPRHLLVVVEHAGQVVATGQQSFLPSLTHQGVSGRRWRGCASRQATSATGSDVPCSSS